MNLYFKLTYLTSFTIFCPSLESMKSMNLAITPDGFPLVYMNNGLATSHDPSRTLFAEAELPFTLRTLIDLSIYPIPI